MGCALKQACPALDSGCVGNKHGLLTGQVSMPRVLSNYISGCRGIAALQNRYIP